MLTALAGIMLAALLGSTGSSHARASAITFGTTEPARTLDPAIAYDHGSQQLIGNLFQTLLSIPPGGNRPAPDAAERCGFRGPRTYVCTLRRGLRFSNGDRLTAADVKFSLERAVAIADPTGPALLLFNLARVEATSARTVTMRLRRPDGSWPSVLTHTVAAIVPRRVFPAFRRLADRKVIGSGPYRLDRYVPSERAVLSRNPRYSGSRPRTEQVTVRSLPTSAALKDAVERGAVDVAFRGFSAAEVAQLRAAAGRGLRVLEGPGAEIHYLVFDLARGPVRDRAVRQAVAQLVDRAALARTAYADTVTPLFSLMPAAFDGAVPAFRTAYGAPDVARARAILAAAGISAPVALDAWYTPSRYGLEEAAAADELRRQLEASGLFTVRLGAREWDAYKRDAFDRHRYPLYALGWFADVADGEHSLSPLLAGGGFMQHGYEDATMNRLLARQRTTTRRSERLERFGRIQAQLARDVPLLPLWERKQIAVVRDGVAGVEQTFDPALLMRFGLVSKTAGRHLLSPRGADVCTCNKRSRQAVSDRHRGAQGRLPRDRGG
jgi:peptide/nickel transport system substrate-binding protein